MPTVVLTLSIDLQYVCNRFFAPPDFSHPRCKKPVFLHHQKLQHRELKKSVFFNPGVQETRFFAPPKTAYFLLVTFQKLGFPCFTQPLTNLRLSDSALELCFSRVTKCKKYNKIRNVYAFWRWSSPIFFLEYNSRKYFCVH